MSSFLSLFIAIQGYSKLLWGKDDPLLDKESGMFLLSDSSECCGEGSELVMTNNNDGHTVDDGIKSSKVVDAENEDEVTALTPSHETC